MADNKEDQLDLEGIIAEEDKKDGIIVTVEGEQPNKIDDKQPSPEETIAALQKEIETVKARENSERERANRLETERSVEFKKATTAIDEVYKARETAIDSSVSSAQANLDSIKRQLRDARERGDMDLELDLTDKLADARYGYNAAMWQKNAIADEKKKREETVKTQIEQPTERQYSSTEKAWIDSHPRYNSDDDYQAYVWSVDALAKKRGIKADTPAYYDFLNERVEKMFPSEEATVTELAKKPAPASSIAAPPSRSTTSVQRVGQNGKQVRLSADQLEAAEYMGMTPAEYAADLVQQEKEKTGRA